MSHHMCCDGANPGDAQVRRERVKLPNNCRKVARQALWKVDPPPPPRDPGEIRICPTIAEQVTESCRKVTAGAETWPK